MGGLGDGGGGVDQGELWAINVKVTSGNRDWSCNVLVSVLLLYLTFFVVFLFLLFYFFNLSNYL